MQREQRAAAPPGSGWRSSGRMGCRFSWGEWRKRFASAIRPVLRIDYVLGVVEPRTFATPGWTRWMLARCGREPPELDRSQRQIPPEPWPLRWRTPVLGRRVRWRRRCRPCRQGPPAPAEAGHADRGAGLPVHHEIRDAEDGGLRIPEAGKSISGRTSPETKLWKAVRAGNPVSSANRCGSWIKPSRMSGGAGDQA